MRKFRLGFYPAIVVIVIILVSLNMSTTASIEEQSVLPLDPISLAYSAHSQINITSDADFSLQAWPGSGTEGDPFRIENLSIVTDGNCISIENTTDYFEITGCYFSSVTTEYDSIFDDSAGAGVFLHNVSNGVIRDCTFRYKYYGMALHLMTMDCMVTESLFDDCLYAGIWTAGSSDCTFTENTFTDNWYALELLGGGGYTPLTSNCVIANNSLSDNLFGINANAIENCIVTGNTIENGQRGIEGTMVNVTVTYNTIDSIAGPGTNVWSDSSGSVSNNHITNCECGLTILQVVNSTISQNVIEECYWGIKSHGDFLLFEKNNLSYNIRGIELQDCHNCTLRYNRITYNSDYGIYLSGSTFNNSLYYNIFSDNNGVNARDNGAHNVWDDGIEEGNNWDNYIGFGTYSILGDAGSIDRFPTNPQHGLQYHVIIPLAVGVLAPIVLVVIIIRGRHSLHHIAKSEGQ